MLVRYWGVRGSIPTPGPSTVRYGGNTSCLELVTDKGRTIIDAGTGIARLGPTIGNPEPLSLLLSHLHWDHIQGFPFFVPVYRRGFNVAIYSGHKVDVSLESVMRGQMQQPNFPLDMDGLPAKLTFHELHEGDQFEVPGALVSNITLHHPNGAIGFAFAAGPTRFVHLTDHEHTPEYEDKVIAFCQGADILSMDTMYTPEQYPNHIGWGHSSWLCGCEIARKARVGQFVLFHHNPVNDDNAMDEIGKAARRAFPNTIVAYEGLELEI